MDVIDIIEKNSAIFRLYIIIKYNTQLHTHIYIYIYI